MRLVLFGLEIRNDFTDLFVFCRFQFVGQFSKRIVARWLAFARWQQLSAIYQRLLENLSFAGFQPEHGVSVSGITSPAQASFENLFAALQASLRFRVHENIFGLFLSVASPYLPGVYVFS